MNTLHLLFSHTLTDEQKTNAEHSLGIIHYNPLPSKLQTYFSQVPPELKDLKEYAKPFQDWLIQSSKPGDYVLIQGDFGLVYLLVNFCKAINIIPIYSTTERKSVEALQDDGSIITQKTFKHKLFRAY